MNDLFSTQTLDVYSFVVKCGWIWTWIFFHVVCYYWNNHAGYWI